MPSTRFLGLDLGIASCGWALIEADEAEGRLIDWGVRCFDAPETAKERTPTNQLRRQFRGMRRVTRRRRQRMAALRRLFAEHEVQAPAEPATANPWALRVAALDRRLAPAELATALLHIAKHRGFRPNGKRASNEASEDSKVLLAVEANRTLAANYRTVGEMYALDPKFAARKRNRVDDYALSIARADLEHETRLLFERQAAFGLACATEALRAAFCSLAFDQRPVRGSEDRVGLCPFVERERRAASRAYSFEMFRFLSRLTALRVGTRRDQRVLTADEIAKASQGFGTQRGMTFARLRKLLGLSADMAFADIPPEEERARDVVNRKSGSGCMQGTAALRAALGEPLWKTLLAYGEKLDAIAAILSFRADEAEIRTGLEQLALPEPATEAVMEALRRGDFDDFTRAGHISAAACRAIIPGLQRGLVYSEACAKAGYDHTRRPSAALSEIANPVARKALIEATKQVDAIIREHGVPERIHVELARDVGKSAEEREEIKRGIEKRNKQRDRLRENFVETVGREPSGAQDMLRFELWHEQAGRCLYTDAIIPPDAILAADNSVQVDHILPWSRFGDDSFVNKTLCFAGANQEKRGRTPWEWMQGEPERWARFAAAIEGSKGMKGRKKRNYLLKDAVAVEERFRSRNLNDTRYAARALMEHLARRYPEDGKRHVFARPGPLTDCLRRAWGLHDLKKTLEPDGERRRADDRHHALDALIVAATTEAALQRLTRAFQAAEAAGSHRDFSGFPPPWPGFVEEARSRFHAILVSRAERGRARGEAHGATIRQVREEPAGPVVYERRAVDKLTEADLARVKDPERNAALIASLRSWIVAQKPKDAPPRSPKGDPIAKVRLRTNDKPDVLVRGGAAARGDMVRVDVFRARNRRGAWEFFLVPIYPHQVADRQQWPTPPMAYVPGDHPLPEGHEFVFSLGSRSFVEVEREGGTPIRGYLLSLDRNTGALTICAPQSTKEFRKGIGARTLARFEKFRVDRLGRVHAVPRETRTWHGVPCI